MPDPSDDEKLLESMGYTQELARNMSGFSNFALSFSIICILTLYSAAFTVLVAGSAVFLYISYIMPVTAGLFAEGRTWTRKGPFDLGGFSRPMAVAATEPSSSSSASSRRTRRCSTSRSGSSSSWPSSGGARARDGGSGDRPSSK